MSTATLTQHTERSHALLSPSSASRWIACTPSARLEAEYSDKRSAAADEGTLAHELAEARLKKELGILKPGAFKKRLAEISTSEWYNSEMEDYIASYVTFVLERFAEAKARTKDAQILLEVKLDMTRWIPEAYGTSDVVIIADHAMEVIDLKYGKGVPVSATGNAQMRIYALGALDVFDYLYSIWHVGMTIYQPRIDNVSSEVIEYGELMAWADGTLSKMAKRAFAGEGVLTPGSHCRFCRHAGMCKALADKNLELARHEFKAPTHLTDEEVSDILFRAEDFTTWINAVKEHALDAAAAGKKWPGFKLVEGRSNRRYTDEDAIADVIYKAGIPLQEVVKPTTLKGVTELEKVLGKVRFQELVGPFITKPPGAPTLVPLNDKRPELDRTAEAARAFTD